VEGRGGILHLDGIQPWVLARWLVEVPVDADEAFAQDSVDLVGGVFIAATSYRKRKAESRKLGAAARFDRGSQRGDVQRLAEHIPDQSGKAVAELLSREEVVGSRGDHDDGRKEGGSGE
jgi:hypothetical protein